MREEMMTPNEPKASPITWMMAAEMDRSRKARKEGRGGED